MQIRYLIFLLLFCTEAFACKVYLERIGLTNIPKRYFVNTVERTLPLLVGLKIPEQVRIKENTITSFHDPIFKKIYLGAEITNPKQLRFILAHELGHQIFDNNFKINHPLLQIREDQIEFYRNVDAMDSQRGLPHEFLRYRTLVGPDVDTAEMKERINAKINGINAITLPAQELFCDLLAAATWEDGEGVADAIQEISPPQLKQRNYRQRTNKAIIPWQGWDVITMHGQLAPARTYLWNHYLSKAKTEAEKATIFKKVMAASQAWIDQRFPNVTNKRELSQALEEEDVGESNRKFIEIYESLK